ncbi:MAG: hypothetical protein ACYC63_17030 [Armatimonadota bacterium]
MNATRWMSLVAALLIASLAHSAQEDPGVRIDVKLPSPMIAICEPLRLCLSATVTGDFDGDFVLWGMGRSGVVITGPAGERRMSDRDFEDPRSAPGDWAPGMNPPKRPIGYTTGTDVWLLYDMPRSEYIFPTPGQYQVKVWVPIFLRKPNWHVVIAESQPITVDVIASKYPRAQRLWLVPPQSVTLSYGGNPLEQLASIEGVNDYGPYAAYVLSLDAKRPIEQRQAFLQQVVGASPPYQLRDLALLNLADLAMKKQDYALAEQSAKRVLELGSAPPWRKTQARRVLEQTEWHKRPK